LDRAAARVREVLSLVNENYVDEKAARYADLATAAMHGLADSLDPHSEFLELKDNQDFEEELTGQSGGIGSRSSRGYGRILVIAPMAGTPVTTGIRRGDEIVKIDGKPVVLGTSIDDVVRRLRGKPKTSVALSLSRAGQVDPINLTLLREVIKTESVRGARVLGDGSLSRDHRIHREHAANNLPRHSTDCSSKG